MRMFIPGAGQGSNPAILLAGSFTTTNGTNTATKWETSATNGNQVVFANVAAGTGGTINLDAEQTCVGVARESDTHTQVGDVTPQPVLIADVLYSARYAITNTIRHTT